MRHLLLLSLVLALGGLCGNVTSAQTDDGLALEQPAYNFCIKGADGAMPLRCICDEWLIPDKLCKRWHIG